MFTLLILGLTVVMTFLCYGAGYSEGYNKATLENEKGKIS